MTGEQICFHVNHDEKMKMREVGKTVHQKKYVKISAVVEMGTKKLMGQALYSYLAETHKTQNDLINTAILEYLKKHKK